MTITISWMLLKRIEDMTLSTVESNVLGFDEEASLLLQLPAAAGSDVACDLASSNIHSSNYKTSWKHGPWKKSLEGFCIFCRERANQSMHLQVDTQSTRETCAEKNRVHQATCTATRLLWKESIWSCIHVSPISSTSHPYYVMNTHIIYIYIIHRYNIIYTVIYNI